MAEVQVLGNMDLRRYIFAYLHKRPAVDKCDCCLIWDQKKTKRPNHVHRGLDDLPEQPLPDFVARSRTCRYREVEACSK